MNMDIYEFKKDELYNIGSIMGNFIQMIKKCIKDGKYQDAERVCDSALNYRDQMTRGAKPSIHNAKTSIHDARKMLHQLTKK